MDQRSLSLPLKKRPLRKDFIFEEIAKTPEIQPLIYSDTDDASSSNRPSSTSSIEIDPPTPVVRRRHTFNGHSSSMAFCVPCNKHFLSRAKYQAHIRRHKSKMSGRYRCPDCDKRFVQKSSLVTHLRIHTGERPYKCTFRACSESFSDLSTFTKHVRTHTGEKPYSCPVCLRSFSQSGNMHRHLRGVHKKKEHSPDAKPRSSKRG